MPDRAACAAFAPWLFALWLAAGAAPARAAEVYFTIDPARSSLALAAGSQAVLALPQNFSGVGFGTRTLAYQAPSGGAPGRLPDGTTSDGLRTSLHGLVRTDFADPPTQLRIERDATQLVLGISGAWSPGPPNLPGVPARANLALRFADPALGWSWSAALRDWRLSLSTEGATAALAPAGADAWSFAAGCTLPSSGCPVYRVENAHVDSSDSRGFLARSAWRSGQDVVASPPSVAAGTLQRLPGGRWELRVPLSITLAVDGLELHDPLGIDHTAVLTGEIVAVPEPGGAAGAAGAALALLALAGRARRARSGRRAAAALGLALLPALGCYTEFDPSLNKTTFLSPIRCRDEWLRVYEIVNGNEILIGGGEVQNPICNPNGLAFSGTISGGIGFSALHMAQFEYGMRASRLTVGATWDFAADSPIPLKIDYRARFEIDYPAGTTDRPNPPQLYYQGWDYGFGLTAGSTQSGSLTVNGVPSGADWAVRTSVLNGAGGTAVVDLALEAFRSGQGKEYQGVAMLIGVQPNQAKTNFDCRRLLGDTLPYRVRNDLAGAYCTPGTTGYECSHSAQCRPNQECYDNVCRPAPYRFRWTF